MEALIPDDLIDRLNQLQQNILKKGLPVLIIFEGSSGRVIGRINNELIRCLEPRGVDYKHFDPTDSDGIRSIMDFLKHTPGNGQIGLYDRSWYSAMIERYSEDSKKKELDLMLDMSNDFERYLVRNGVLLIKILLKASGSALKEYGPQYGPSGPKKSFLSMDHIDPMKYREVMFDRFYEKAEAKYAPWSEVRVEDVRSTVLETVDVIIKRIEERLNSEPIYISPKIARIFPNPRIKTNTCKSCPRHNEVLSDLSKKIWELQMDLSLSNRSMIICFEGWDAAGKGTCIKHLCHALNPRGYEVFQTKAPNDLESSHTYLWRFGRGIPKNGHITVFDRSWYGRMLVEHVEGFCTDEEYKRAPHEINAFEKFVINKGAIIVKFWLDITKDEQLLRFEKRTNDPLKQWKMTDDDWRNRSKWDQYDSHIDIMIESTNTEYAPWTIVESNNKKFAQVKVLKTVYETLRQELKK